MGAQWKHAGRQANAAKKGAMHGKLVKEIQVAAKMGSPDPASNARLRAAIESAKRGSVTRDTIDRAIKKGAGLLDDGVQFETLTYEGFAPHQVPLIVECLTDNKNRTAADLRVLFRKGQIGNSGSVSWMFDRLGVVEATTTQTKIDLESAAIEAGAQNVEVLDAEDLTAGQSGGRFFTETSDLAAVTEALTQAGWTVTKSELSWQVKNALELPADQMQEVADFLTAIDDHDDVHRLYAGVK